MITLLAEAAAGYVPFMTPLRLWDAWPWLAIPLTIAVSVVYKTIKCREVRQIPRESAVIALWIVLAMIGVGGGVLIIYRLLA